MLDWLKKILGDSYTEDIDKQVSVEIGKHFVSKTDFNAKNDELKDAKGQISTLNETIKGLEGKDGDLEELRKKVKQYEDAEEQRQKDAKEAERIAGVKARFAPLRGENQFLNPGTEQWIFGEFEKALADKANEGKSDADIYAAITKDQNIYVNPQQQRFTNPPVGSKRTTSSPEEYMKGKYKNNPFFNG